MINKSFYIVIVIGLLTIPQWSFAQRKAYKPDKRQKSNYAYPSPNNFLQGGWLFDAGLTTTFGPNSPEGTTVVDTTVSYPFDIRPGIALGVGRYYNLKKGRSILRYIDASIGYKMLWNSETQHIDINGLGEQISTTNDNTAHYANLNINFNNVINLSNYSFIQNTIGFNIDYRFLETETTTHPSIYASPNPFVMQAHYKLAVGFMIDTDIAVIPYIEVPLFNITPSQSQFSQLDYFNQSYQTVIIGVRVMLFRFGTKDCPKAINTEGKAKNNGY